jgi:Protein of unknown function (DUF4230)
MAKNIVVILTTGIICIIVSTITYNISYNKGYRKGFDTGEDKSISDRLDESYKSYNKVKQKEKKRYVEFVSKENFSELMPILYEMKENPGKDLRQTFSGHINTINTDIIQYISDSYGFSDTERGILMEEYNRVHDSISEIYYTKLQSLNASSRQIRQKQDSFNVINSPIISYSSYTSAMNLSSILASLTCSIFDLLIGLIRMNPALSFATSTLFGMTCDLYMSDIMPTYNDSLQANAFYYDIQVSKVSIESQIRKTVSKLITVEDDFNTTVYRSSTSRFLLFFTSSAEAGFSISSKISAGVDLNKYYNMEINHTSKEVLLTLAQPELLSTQSNYKITYVDNGIIAKITTDMINEAMAEGNRTNEQQAIQSGILQSAKLNAEKTIQTFIQPILAHPGGMYHIRVRFQDDNIYPKSNMNTKAY